MVFKMKVFNNKDQVINYLNSKWKFLDDHDNAIIDEWINNDYNVLLISDNESHAYLKQYILDNDMLCYFNTSFIVSNLKPEFITLPNKVIDILKEEYDHESLKALVNLDDLVHDALRYDGLPHFINSYDSKSVDLYFDDDVHCLIAY